MKQFRRKRGHDNFTIKKKTKICEFHFDISWIKVGYDSGRKSLISGSIPTIFKFKKQKETPKRKSPKKRNALVSDLIGNESEYISSSSCEGIKIPTVNDSDDQVMENPEDESKLLKKENEMLRISVKNLKTEFNNLKLE